MSEWRVKMPTLHRGQREVFDSPVRFRVLACGRRWGKTTLGALECVVCALQGGRAWWVAPTYPIASIGWRMMKRLTRRVPGTLKNETDRRIEFPTGGWVQVKSADNPDSLRGEGLDLVVLDEAAYIAEEAWTAALRPALSDRGGRALFISTPAGRNWFWRLWRRGMDGESGWQSWQFPTSASPYVSPDEIQGARQTLPERIFEQEYLAEFVDDAGMVFRHVEECVDLSPLPRPSPERMYVCGVDWGRPYDWTVITVVDVGAKRVVAMDRFNIVDYAVQSDRLRAIAETWRPTVIIAEANAMGEPIIEQLQRAGLPVLPFWTTNATKSSVVEALALAFERREIAIPDDRVLLDELKAFTVRRLPSGLFQYGAPEGEHDDCVMSLALAWYGATQASSPAIVEI